MSEKPKAWIYRGETRTPEIGEWFAPAWVYCRDGAGKRGPMFRDDKDVIKPIEPSDRMILEPLGDVVLVPREKIEALQDAVWQADEAKMHIPVRADVNAILACAEPVEKKDEILEAMHEAEKVLWMHAGTKGETQRRALLNAIDLREAELKARK